MAVAPGDRPDPFPVRPVAAPPNAEVRVPGGRSITNRALVAAALAEGTSVLDGAGRSDDTEAMADGLRALGATIEVDGDQVTVGGVAGRPRGPAEVFTRLSGTTSRFLTPVAALAAEPVRIDAAGPMRARPMGGVLDALRDLGVTVTEEGEAGHLPVRVRGPWGPVDQVEVAGTVSSQFTSGLLLASGARFGGLVVRQATDRMVSAPYVAMTAAVMARFGVEVEAAPGRWVVPGGGYVATTYAVEPDAATAAYFLAAAALTGGRVRVPGLPPAALQADAALVDVMEAMGATVTRDGRGTEVRGPAPGPDGRVRLRGGTFDLTAFSDMAPTVAVLAAFATEAVEVTGVGFIRGKETDRIAAPVTELRRCGVDAAETGDGFVVRPGGPGPHGAVLDTYDDHRMAMSFALLGLVVDGIAVRDPGCVAKTHPGFWDDLERLAR